MANLQAAKVETSKNTLYIILIQDAMFASYPCLFKVVPLRVVLLKSIYYTRPLIIYFPLSIYRLYRLVAFNFADQTRLIFFIVSNIWHSLICGYRMFFFWHQMLFNDSLSMTTEFSLFFNFILYIDLSMFKISCKWIDEMEILRIRVTRNFLPNASVKVVQNTD